MTPRKAVALALVLIFLGLAVIAVGVHLALGFPAGLIAYGSTTALTGVAVVALWA